jgi:hypothetical protein
MSDQAFLYPILKEKGTQKLTYLDALILDSLRGGKLGYQYLIPLEVLLLVRARGEK